MIAWEGRVGIDQKGHNDFFVLFCFFIFRACTFLHIVFFSPLRNGRKMRRNALKFTSKIVSVIADDESEAVETPE